MKQLLVLSGKGGTGKTTVSNAFIYISDSKAFADCDVDAPNLHILSGNNFDEVKKSDYFALKKAVIDKNKCAECHLCESYCRFDAIKNCQVKPFECEGCGVCEKICPTHAISMQDSASGELLLYKNQNKVFSSAKLYMGSGASGKLVTAVKKQLTENSCENFAIIDGSPGIGCPVIASISGAGLVLLVAEPTVSGIHDLKRIIKTSQHFGVKCVVCINKSDINIQKTNEIINFCKDNDIEVAGQIPYDDMVIKSLEKGENIMAYKNSKAAIAINQIWNFIKDNYINKGVNL